MLRKLILAAFLFCSSSWPLSAAFANPSEFYAAGVEIPQTLQAKGYSSFGQLDLANLISQMQNVRIQFSSQLTAAKRNQNGRISARWEVTANGRIIHVYSPSWGRFSEQRSMLALHEYLGILGYADNNYWLSTQMWTLSLKESDALSHGERSAIERSIGVRAQGRQQMAASGGGVVGVGGGGEGGTIWVRQKRIKEGLGDIASGSRDREQAIGNVYHELEGTVEAGYGGFESKETKRKAREMAARQKPYCLVSGGLCRKFTAQQGSNCACRGRSESGTVIYTENPWDLLD